MLAVAVTAMIVNKMANDESDLFFPDELRCSITLELLRQPYVAGDGNTYELDAISAWLSARNVSPLTGEPMPTRLVQNVALQKLIADWPSITESIRNSRPKAAAAPPLSAGLEARARVLAQSLEARALDLDDAKAQLRRAHAERDAALAEARVARLAQEELLRRLDDLAAQNRRLRRALETVHEATASALNDGN